MKTTMNVATLELRNLSHRYMTEGLMIAGLFHITVIGGIQFLMQSTISDSALDNPWKKRVREIYIQPAIWNRPVIPNVSVAQSAKTNVGVPIPIPETEIDLETTIPTQIEMNNPTGVENGGEEGTIISEGTRIDGEETAPEIFIPGIEKFPVPIYNPSPKYPEIARRSGMEGTVYIKMWVTKEGKVKQADVVKSTSPIFDQDAINAAVLWKFTPAIMNNGPVSVWVTVPFKFRLNSN